ncbi:MAG: HD domain-containing protein, partial [Acidobacteriota bacterium]|nr:HD domain-containing protein [Acidobacteriota bacterium]
MVNRSTADGGLLAADCEKPAIAVSGDVVETVISSTDRLFEDLKTRVHELRPKDDLAPLDKAYQFASKYHLGQVRDSGEPYMTHPLMVAHILAGMRMDVVSLETGLLHDVVEDTLVDVETVRKNFGEEVGRCVDGVTKLSKLDFSSAEERQAESFRKMLLAMVDDIRVIIVKLADRLHNMRTLGCLPSERKERIARETLEIYAPIANRLGMGKIRGELEDLSFQHLEPADFAAISQLIESKRAGNEEFLDKIKRTVEAELRREGIPARVDG